MDHRIISVLGRKETAPKLIMEDPISIPSKKIQLQHAPKTPQQPYCTSKYLKLIPSVAPNPPIPTPPPEAPTQARTGIPRKHPQQADDTGHPEAMPCHAPRPRCRGSHHRNAAEA